MMFVSFANAAGTVSQLIWSSTPSTVNQGLAFSAPVVIKTADSTSTPSTVGLPAVKMITLAIVSGTGNLIGTQTANIGTSGGNGTVTFSGLVIDQPGSFTLQVSDEGAYLPTNITAGASCQLWLDAADYSSIMKDSSGVFVTNWIDKSGHFNNATNNIGGTTGSATNCPYENLGASGLSANYAGLNRTLFFNGPSYTANNFGLHMNLSSLAGTNYTVITLNVPYPVVSRGKKRNHKNRK